MRVTRLSLASVLLLSVAAPSRADPPEAARPNRDAIDRGLKFLRADAEKWRKDRECSTCHHGVMTVWALTEAKARGHEVPAEEMADILKWTKGRLLERIDLPRDTRPGWSMVSTPALYLATMALCIPKQESLSADERKHIAGHLLRHQEADGSWAWSSAPAKNRPPPVFESDEVATILGLLALDSQQSGDEARRKATAWLAKAKSTGTTQAAALHLLLASRAGEPGKIAIERFLTRQQKDGGWGQIAGAPSDAYATGQALYVLNVVGVKPDRPEVANGVRFLIATQKPDGSWPMAPRSHVGATPAKNIVPITYFGSAWATLGLLRSTK